MFGNIQIERIQKRNLKLSGKNTLALIKVSQLGEPYLREEMQEKKCTISIDEIVELNFVQSLHIEVFNTTHAI
eukprot:GDKH01009657.1.p1 GENE.GDKH01009657.1~~GDKH01009657.1.p1  ORF type:complete len:73 (-),score=4.46 GDKH01009657.1:68-286(-)